MYMIAWCCNVCENEASWHRWSSSAVALCLLFRSGRRRKDGGKKFLASSFATVTSNLTITLYIDNAFRQAAVLLMLLRFRGKNIAPVELFSYRSVVSSDGVEDALCAWKWVMVRSVNSSVKQLFARMYPTPDWLVPEIQLSSETLYCSRMSWVQGGVQKTTVQLYLLIVQVERRQDFNCLVLMILLVVFLLVLPCFLSLTFSSLLHFSVLY